MTGRTQIEDDNNTNKTNIEDSKSTTPTSQTTTTENSNLSIDLKSTKMDHNGNLNDTERLDIDLNSMSINSRMLWNPKNSKLSQNTRLLEFQAHIESKFQTTFASYDELYKWSIENYVSFWEEFWHFSKIIHSTPYQRVLDKPEGPVDNLPFKWFEGALLNYAENLLRHDDDKVAVYSFGEAFSTIKSMTHKELRNQVRLYQSALRSFGIGRNDVVAGYMPNCLESLIAKLAVNSLGAVWSCASPDFGPESVIERFSQIEPKMIFSVTSVGYNGKKHDHKNKLIQVIDSLKSIQHVVLVPFYNDELDDNQDIPKKLTLSEFLEKSDPNSTLAFEQVPFNHPLVILYSSGTTGHPKCIVHSHGGTLIQHLKEHLLHGNMTRDDIIIYYTTTGWMMYNWLISSLAVGATIVLYDGSPFLPTVNVLWDLVDKLKITMFGTSAKWLAVVEEKKCIPKLSNKLDSLKWIFSTGSPLKPSSFEYVYQSIKQDLIVGSITGGSDIISLFCGHNANLPVYCGQIQCRHLGMAVECWNEDGRPVYDECGDLVCTRPFPSMPIYFSNDPEFKKYKASYFEKFPGVWAHGDFCMIDSQTGGVTMFGRSDGTLNPNGVRFGSADIYNIIETMSEIDDSLCVGQKNHLNPTEERVILFLKLKPGHDFNEALVNKVKTKIRTSLSPRHVPNIVCSISEIPYTLNHKKVEVPVRRILEGHHVTPSSSLVNPKCLDQFRLIEALYKW